MTAGRWFVAAALALAVAACAWILATTVGDDDTAGAARDVPVAADPVRDAAARHAADATGKGAATVAPAVVPAVVEIDDAPLPEGATATIRGTVRDDLGKPVAYATVSAIVTRVVATQQFPEPPYDATTGADGRYVLAGLDPSAVWRLEAEARGHAPGAPATAVVLSARRMEATYDFVLPRDGAIDATVLGADGSAIPHDVTVLPLTDDPSAWGLDESRLAPGRYRVLADAPGHAGECRFADVAAGETTHVEFRLADEAVITGALLDSDGTPLGKYEIVAVAADGAGGPSPARGVTAADGTFRIGGLRRTAYRLGLGDANFAADTPGPVTAPASGVRVQIRDDARVTFRLVYPADFTSSDRAADVRVDVIVRDTDVSPSPRWDLDVGTVVVPGGTDAEVAVTAIHCLTVRRRVKVRPGETLDLGDVRPERAGEFAGRVVDAQGCAVPGAWLRADAAWVLPQMSMDDGSFRFDRLPRDGCVIDVEAQGYAPVRVDCRVGHPAPPAVVLQRGGVLWIRGAARDGATATGAALRLADAHGGAWPFVAGRLDDRGECAARVPPGRWHVEVTGCAPADADVREGATTTVRVVASGR